MSESHLKNFFKKMSNESVSLMLHVKKEVFCNTAMIRIHLDTTSFTVLIVTRRTPFLWGLFLPILFPAAFQVCFSHILSFSLLNYFPEYSWVLSNFGVMQLPQLTSLPYTRCSKRKPSRHA